MSDAVSIIIASHRPEYIADCVAHALAACERVPGSEVVVVADYEVARLRERFPAVIWIGDRRRGIPQKRNTGIRVSRTAIIGFTDDDCRCRPDWAENAVAFLADHPGSAAVEGRTVVSEGKRDGFYREAIRLQRSGYRTNNIFYRREPLLKAGLFDERFEFQHEDADLAFTIREMGHDIGYCDRCVVEHRLRSGEPWDLLKNCGNRRFSPMLYRKHPASYRRMIRSPVPPAVGVLLIAHLLILFCIVAQMPRATAAVAALDAGLALVFGLRRAGMGRHTVRQMWVEWLSYLLAPVVLEGALLYGSIRSRKLLLV